MPEPMTPTTPAWLNLDEAVPPEVRAQLAAATAEVERLLPELARVGAIVDAARDAYDIAMTNEKGLPDDFTAFLDEVSGREQFWRARAAAAFLIYSEATNTTALGLASVSETYGELLAPALARDAANRARFEERRLAYFAEREASETP